MFQYPIYTPTVRCCTAIQPTSSHSSLQQSSTAIIASPNTSLPLCAHKSTYLSMNVVVGDATGRLRVCSLKVDGPIKKMGSQEASRGGISAMAFAGAENKESEVAIALSKGTIEVWNTVNQEKVAHMQGLPLEYDNVKYVGLYTLRIAGGSITEGVQRKLISATSAGAVSIAPWLPYLPDLDENDDEVLEQTMSRAQIIQFKKKRNDERTALMKEREDEYVNGTAFFQCGKHLEKFRISPNEAVLAAGGKNNKFRLYDIETQQPIYSCRNLPNNWLNLAQPNWDMDFAFFGEYDSSRPRSGSKGYQIITSTGYKELRLYDTRDGTKRPSQHYHLPHHPARSVAITHDENYVLAGDAAGKIHKLDLRKNLNPIGTMKGHCGSIRQLSMHPTLNMVAAVGLDRYLRVYDVDTRNLLKEIYLTQKLSDCLFSEIVPGAKAKSFIGTNTAAKQMERGEQPTDDAIWARFLAMDDKKGGEDGHKKSTIKAEDDDMSIMDEEESDDQLEDVDFDEFGEGEFDPELLMHGEGEFDFASMLAGHEGELDMDLFAHEGEQSDDMFGEGEFDFDAFAGPEGELDLDDNDDEDAERFDFEFDEDDDEDDFLDEDDDEDGQEFSCGFTILGEDGKPISTGTSIVMNKPGNMKSALQQPTKGNSNQKQQTRQPPSKQTQQTQPQSKQTQPPSQNQKQQQSKTIPPHQSKKEHAEFVTEPVKRKFGDVGHDSNKKQRR